MNKSLNTKHVTKYTMLNTKQSGKLMCK